MSAPVRDVVVLGGGPAGLATAVALARLGRSVVVLERTRYDRPRAGETFGGDLRPLLQALGVWDDFLAFARTPFRGVASAWGSATVEERASIVNPFGDGWHVDRAGFDALLARAAARSGVAVEQGTGAPAVTWTDGLWRVRPDGADEVRGRYLVDASGRGAPATAVCFPERRWLRADRLVALVGSMTGVPGPIEPMLLLEAVEEGWWYSVPQPDGSLLVALMTDGDLLPARGRSALATHFSSVLGRTVHTAARSAGGALAAPPWIARADSGLLLPDRGPAWRAVGDAAMACDPLAGDGVVRALRAAAEAAPEIERALSGTEPDAPASAGERFRDYLDMRARYYGSEGRWPNATFWARRRATDWKTAPLFLDPLRVLRWDGKPRGRDVMARVEALVPPHAVRALLDHLRTPRPAHEALVALREAAPLEDRRLLVALQQLLSSGVVEAGAGG